MADRPDVTIVVDGLEIAAPEGAMLYDAAKQGDVEIPVFCYEPKLGEPVGACRMCLVEIEGIPKLQTSCSTPIRDGMVVYTQTDRVKEAQSAVVEFLLVNHPLDCPVCDKGGECPLQDIAMGWGPGRSRYTDPKRHFQKPIPLSPLVRIDRERCILCYRCVRFSQEVAEDEQLQLIERSSDTYVGTFDDRPYIAPFHGNIIELCPVGALTSEAYRFRARPWDIEDAGSVCTLCPSQCNVKLTVRDEQVQRVLARDNAEVDDGWLCDKGRFGFQMVHAPERIVEPMVRRGGALVPATWEEALDAAARALLEAGERTAAIAGGGTSNEEGYLLQRIVRGALGSADVTAGERTARPLALARRLARPELSIAMSGIDSADSILLVGVDPMHEMPILDLRIRKAMRRGGARLALATERPTSLDGGAEARVVYPPGEVAELLESLAGELGAEGYEASGGEDVRALAGALCAGTTAIVFGERVGWGEGGARALRALLASAGALGLEDGAGGLLEVPRETNGRGLLEVGVDPRGAPGLGETGEGRDAEAVREALAARELEALVLSEVDPVNDFARGSEWDEALSSARFVLAIAAFEGGSTARADVVLPAETHAEKDGTATHPDGRLQRLRASIPRPGNVRPTWQALVELAARLGHETGLDAGTMVLEAIASEVPFYAGLTAEEIGGAGVRWQERPAAAGLPVGEPVPAASAGRISTGVPATNGHLRLGTYRDLWSSQATDHSPALRFLRPEQQLEIAPADAERLGLAQGDDVEVVADGRAVAARVALHERIAEGTAFMRESIPGRNANQLPPGAAVEVRGS